MKTIATMTTSELIQRDIEIGEQLDFAVANPGDPSLWGDFDREILRQRREVRAELNRREHERSKCDLIVRGLIDPPHLL